MVEILLEHHTCQQGFVQSGSYGHAYSNELYIKHK